MHGNTLTEFRQIYVTPMIWLTSSMRLLMHFLMPSRFEPCGLTQLISFRYGTVPIVRETGGLKDTVKPYNEYENSGDGFSFSNYNADEMLAVINYSKHIFFDKKREWNQIVDRGMANDFSWNASKFKYEGLYNYLIGE